MIPTKLHMHRWCQHYDRELTFVQGMNSLVGPNGRGKSNIIRALCLCFGLGLDTNANKLTDNITVGYDKGSLTLTFEHDGQEGFIQVNLSRNYTNDSEIQKQEVDAALADEAIANRIPSGVE